MEDKKISILYVDDEENNLFSFKATFRLKYKVFTAISGADAIDIVKNNQIHIIITDQRMPDIRTWQLSLMRSIKEKSFITSISLGVKRSSIKRFNALMMSMLSAKKLWRLILNLRLQMISWSFCFGKSYFPKGL